MGIKMKTLRIATAAFVFLSIGSATAAEATERSQIPGTTKPPAVTSTATQNPELGFGSGTGIRMGTGGGGGGASILAGSFGSPASAGGLGSQAFGGGFSGSSLSSLCADSYK